MNSREICELAPVIPVLTVESVESAVPLARALVAGGLPALEVTLRTEAALDAIEAMSEVEGAVVGVGTLLTAKDIKAAVKAGARFGVSPGTTHELLDAAEKAKLPILPGVCTPSEVLALLDRGIEVMKFFPAEPAGGTAMLRAISAPIPQARFCPTGGIGLASAPEYLSLPNVACVGGSWVAPRDAIAEGDWDRIEALAREAAGLSR